MDTLRHLKIATGVVKRTTRELLMYKQETSAEAEKLRQMKDAGVGEGLGVGAACGCAIVECADVAERGRCSQTSTTSATRRACCGSPR